MGIKTLQLNLQQTGANICLHPTINRPENEQPTLESTQQKITTRENLNGTNAK